MVDDCWLLREGVCEDARALDVDVVVMVMGDGRVRAGACVPVRWWWIYREELRAAMQRHPGGGPFNRAEVMQGKWKREWEREWEWVWVWM
jgi:hypothetical protein